LHVALNNRQEDTARVLIKNGVDLLAKTKNGCPTLWLAIHRQQEAIALLLIESGVITKGWKFVPMPFGNGTTIDD
jgi:hypothetical protein